MNNRNRKKAIKEFIEEMQAGGYELHSEFPDKIVFVHEDPASNSPQYTTFTRAAIDDIISLAETDS